MVTARKDIDTLVQRGLMVRTWGGAAIAGVGASFEPLYRDKRDLNSEAKMRIANTAATLIEEGDTLILDSGSTAFEVVSHLKEYKNLTVITYDLMIAVELSTNSNVNVIVVGGIVRNNLYSLHGALTLQALSDLHVDKVLLTADAVDAEWGVTNATIEGASIKQALVKAADEVILLADRSKFGRRALARVAPISSLDCVVADGDLPEDIQEALRDANVTLMLTD